jgi:hypothetical protein
VLTSFSNWVNKIGVDNGIEAGVGALKLLLVMLPGLFTFMALPWLNAKVVFCHLSPRLEAFTQAFTVNTLPFIHGLSLFRSKKQSARQQELARRSQAVAVTHAKL